MAISAGGMWAADDRRDLIRASDYPTSGAWLVTVEGVTVGSVQPTYSSARAKRWTARHATSIEASVPWHVVCAWSWRRASQAVTVRWGGDGGRAAWRCAGRGGGSWVRVAGAEAGDQRAERDLGFDSGQRCAVAEVDAAAEAEVLVVWAGGVVGSNRSGSRNRLGSRLPEASTSTSPSFRARVILVDVPAGHRLF